MKRIVLTGRSMILLCSVAALMFAACAGHTDSLSFTQLSFNLDGVTYDNTEWGNAILSYTGQDPILYFNLAVNGQWQVQNWPVLSNNGNGVLHDLYFSFDLGVPRGTVVSTLDYDYMLTPAVQTTMPGGSFSAPVVPDLQEIYSGFVDGSIGSLLAPAGPLVGGEAADPKKHAHKDFPKQGCGENECCPAAVSSSLKFLKKTGKITIDDSKITIDETKKATNWGTKSTPTGPKVGCWINAGKDHEGKDHKAWWEDKKEYYKDKVTTRKITNVDDLIKEIDAGQDVEIQMTGHTAALVSVTKTKDGKYKLTVSHDLKQKNKAEDCVEEPMDYDPATGNLNGKFSGTYKFLYAVVESPVPEPGSIVTLLVGLAGALAYMRKRIPA